MSLGGVRRGGLDLHLVVIGDLTAEWRTRLAGAARSAGVLDRLIVMGRTGDDLLRACYRRAVLTVTPSLAEGFGFPVLESAACGTPALASATTALGEAAATPLATFDPTDAEAVASAIIGVLSDDRRRAVILEAQQDLAARSTWDAVAARTASALDELGRTLPAAAWGSPPIRPRLALVGPLPPAGGGIGLYNARLLGAAPGTAALDAVTPMVASPDLPGGVGHISAGAFGIDARPASYDAVVYTPRQFPWPPRYRRVGLALPGMAVAARSTATGTGRHGPDHLRRRGLRPGNWPGSWRGPIPAGPRSLPFSGRGDLSSN